MYSHFQTISWTFDIASNMALSVGKHQLLFISMLIFAVTWVVFIYVDIVNHQFLNWDDSVYILSNPFLETLSFDNIIQMFTDYSLTNWHPLTWLTHAIDLSIFGKNAFAMKLVNVLLHVANCVVLYFLFSRILRSLFRKKAEQAVAQPEVIVYSSLLAAIVFLVHPQHVESVVWVAERKDVLCALFYFMTMLFYMKYQNGDGKNWMRLAVLSAVLSILSKPMAVSIPVALIVLDVFVLNKIEITSTWQKNINALLKDKWVFILLSLILSILTIMAQSQAIKGVETLGVFSRLINASIASIHYLSTIVLPTGLLPFYPYSELALNPSITSILPILLLAGVFVFFVYLWRRGHPLYLFAMVLFIVSIFPVIGVVAVGHQAYADRYTYIPCSLFYLALSYSFVALMFNMKIDKTVKIVMPVALFGLVSLYGYFSVVQVRYWKNDETLWSEVARRYPSQIYLAHQNLGNVYLIQSKFKEALRHYKIALKLDGNAAITYENIGRVYSQIGEKEKEIEYYLIAIEKDPESIWPKLSAGYFYLAEQNMGLATKYFRSAEALEPMSPPVIIANAKLDLLEQRVNQAKERLNWLLQQRNNNVDAIWILAQIYINEGDRGRAKTLLEKLLLLNPDNQLAFKLLNRLRNELS